MVGTFDKLRTPVEEQELTRLLEIATRTPVPMIRNFGSTFGSGFDGAHAILMVKNAAQVSRSGSDIVYMTDRFVLGAVNESLDVRFAPIFSLSQALVMTSGRLPTWHSYTGKLLVNQNDGDTRKAFEEAYHRYFKISACLDRDEKWYVQLLYRDQVVKGYVTSLDFTTTADDPNAMAFSFNMFVFD